MFFLLLLHSLFAELASFATSEVKQLVGLLFSQKLGANTPLSLTHRISCDVFNVDQEGTCTWSRPVIRIRYFSCVSSFRAPELFSRVAVKIVSQMPTFLRLFIFPVFIMIVANSSPLPNTDHVMCLMGGGGGILMVSPR